MKKGKGKQKGHSSKSEEGSESEDEEIEAMFIESRNPSKKSGFSQLQYEVSIVSGE